MSKVYEGTCVKKPWDYDIVAVIPFRDTLETLPICIKLLQLQTIKPYIMIIDTGSKEEVLQEVIKLRSESIEVHSLVLNGVMHPSDYPAMAMDLAFTLCRSRYLFATHADVYLRRRDFLEYILDLCKTQSPAVGYEITPRAHNDWVGMLSHTASIYDMKIMDNIDFAWSLRKLCHKFNISNHSPNLISPNWPDTEILGNYILREHNIKPYLIGKEENYLRTCDENIDHFRSYTSAKMYSFEHFNKAKKWFVDAQKEADERIKEWSKVK